MNFELDEQRKLWDRALGDLAVVDHAPEPELMEFLQLGGTELGRHGLDVGCGFGRHTIAALKLGFEMSAIDFSINAIQETRAAVSAEGFCADVQQASMDHLPFQTNTFDFAFSWCVLNHGTRTVFERAITEVLRVIRPGGRFFGFVMSRNDSRFGKGIKIAEGCYAFTEGPETGVCHYFPTQAEVTELLQRSTVIERFEEVSFSGQENEYYHPEMAHSCHFRFMVRKS